MSASSLGEAVAVEAGSAPEALDFRLAIPTVFAWLAAWWGITQAWQSLAALALATAGGGLIAAACASRYRPARHRRDPRPGAGTDEHTYRGPSTALLAVTCLAVCAVVIVAAAGQARRNADPITAAAASGQRVSITGVVVSTPRLSSAPGEARYLLRLATTRVAGQPSDAEVLLIADASWKQVSLGDVVTVSVAPRPAEPGRSISALARVRGSPLARREGSGILAAVAHVREGLAEAAREAASGGSWPQGSVALVAGVALGDDAALPPALRKDFRAVSLTHLIAVSGQHVAMTLGLVLTALGFLPRWWRVGAGAVVLIGLVMLVQPSGSVLRAGVMGGVMLLAVGLGRRGSSVPALCGAVLLLLLLDPWQARDVGFALSVTATAAIVLAARPAQEAIARVLARAARALSRHCRGARNFPSIAPSGAHASGGGLHPGVHDHGEGAGGVVQGCAGLLAVPMVAQAACTPLLILLTPSIGLWSVPANVLAAPVVPLATLSGLASAAVAVLTPGVASVLAWPAVACCAWLVTVAQFFAGLPGASVPWVPGLPGAVLITLIEAGILILLLLARSGTPTSVGEEKVCEARADPPGAHEPRS